MLLKNFIYLASVGCVPRTFKNGLSCMLWIEGCVGRTLRLLSLYPPYIGLWFKRIKQLQRKKFLLRKNFFL